MTHNQQSTEKLELLSTAQCWNSNDIKSRKYIDDASFLLNEQWPRGGSVVDYKCKLLGIVRSDIEMFDSLENTPLNVESLPCSYLLIDSRKSQLVGHGRLTECFEGPGGNAIAATYIITQPRRMGYGRVLMTLLEHQAVRLGYHYIYLWTTTAIPFYQKLKYSRTERVSLNSACLKTLQTQQVGALEAMLTKRCRKASNSPTNLRNTKETVTLPPDAVTENDIWLRKRLVESVESTAIPFENRIAELHAVIHQYPSTIIAWKYYFNHIPWQQQIGPSCGLAALRMLREHYITNDESMNLPSLLTEAQTKGYSFDGEVFNVDNMMKLANYCGLNSCLKSFQTMSIVDIWNILKAGGTLILPYDSQPFTRNPCMTGGKNAHYGIVVGMMLECQNDHDRTIAVVFGVENDESIVVPKAPQIHAMTNIDNIQEDATHILLLIQHGLSSKWTIASMEDLMSSNGQLYTIDTTKCCYLPEHTTMNLSDSIIVCYGQKVE